MNTGIHRDEVIAIFRMFVPSDVQVVEISHEQYVSEARHHPFIAEQIRLGIYNDEDFDQEFLSVARTFAADKTIEVDTFLVELHMEGVDTFLALAYCANIALHEYHHITDHTHETTSHTEQLQRELDCDEFLQQEHPEIAYLSEQAEEQSATISKIYERCESLRP